MWRPPRAPSVLLGGALLVWTALRVRAADAELNARPVVDGPFRRWLPPHDDGPFGGHLIDPRSNTLANELTARYGASVLPPLSPTTRGPGAGDPPRLIFPAPGETHLVVGTWGGDLVVFTPGLGVAVVDPDRVPADVPARPLDVPRERVF
ncbi:hypothetical protein L6V77_09015 [Myxococcota bacterium]|nr:hypothetical protein [Myxococcota bacterium]